MTQLASQFNGNGCTVEIDAIKAVPVKAILVFNDIPLDVNRLKVLQVSVSVRSENDTKWEYPQYRDVTVK